MKVVLNHQSMRLFVVFVLLANFAWAEDVQTASPIFGYISKYGIPRADEIFQAEKELTQSRITSGVPAGLGQYPFQAGLIGEIVGTDRRTVCGAILVTANRVITAAHCSNDGLNEVLSFTVVLGSVFLFSGGTRIESTTVAVHPNYSVLLARNDVAVIFLASSVLFSDTIGPVSLPTESEIFENYVGEPAIAIGFGLTSNDGVIQPDQSLNHVRLKVISNTACSLGFPLVIQPSHICTSGLGGVSICRGDSGGPLVAVRNGRMILIGVSSFVSNLGCEANMPAAFTRVTYYLDFLTSNIE